MVTTTYLYLSPTRKETSMIRTSLKDKLSLLKYVAAALFLVISCILTFYPLNTNAADYPDKARFYYDDSFGCVSNLNDKQPGYCVDLVLAPDEVGQWEYKMIESSHTLDFAMYHGADGPEFLQHHTIFGVDVDDAKTAHGITQLVIWATQGIKTGNGLDENCNYFITDENSIYKPDHGKPALTYKKLSPEHQKLCKLIIKKALEYEKRGPTEKDPEYKCSRLYKCNNASYQRFVTYYSLGNLKINKVSSLPDITDNNSLYDLENTYFHIYQGVTWEDAKDTGKWMKTTAQINEDGKVVAKCVDVDNPNNDFIKLKNGAYWLLEEKYEDHTNTGYLKHSDPIKVYIFPKQTTYASNCDLNHVENDPKYVTVETLVEKYTSDESNASTEAAPLENVKFEVNYYDTFTKFVNNSFVLPDTKPQRTWILSSDNNGLVKLDDAHKIGGDSFYTNKDSKPCIPRGTITIQEIEAPDEYKVDDTVHVIQTDKVNGKPIGLLPIKLNNSIKRSDLSFTKIDATTQNKMANIPFKITSIDTNESHILVTDENGCINTASTNIPHSHNTNINDKYVDNNKVIDEKKLTSDSGIWFTNGKSKNTEVNDYVGALPFGKYKIEELRCSGNINQNCQPFEVMVEKDQKNYCLNDIKNTPIEFDTTLRGEADNKFISNIESNVLKDTVHLTNLSPNTKYTLVGKLHLLDDSNDLGELKDGSNNAIHTTKEFETTSDTSVDITLDYNIDGSKYIGKQLVSCVELYNHKDLVATHNNISDPNQTVSIPAIRTLATNKNNHQNLEVGKEVEIVDEVKYYGLFKNKTYTLVGKIYNVKDTSNPIKTFENTFVARTANGKTTNSTTIDTTALNGEDLVLTEELYFEDNLIAKHEDFSDTKQTVHIPSISTKAVTDSNTNCFDRLTTKTIVDTVKYENLIPGNEYKIIASLNTVDASKSDESEISEASKSDNLDNNSNETSKTKKPDQANSVADIDDESKETAKKNASESDSKKINVKEVQTEEILFTPEKPSGEVDIEFKINERNYTNKIVVFDKLYLHDTLLITHDDIEDANQTIYIPEVITKLSSTNGSKEITPSKATQLIDVVEISNLPIGTEYKAVGKLVILDKKGNVIKLPKLLQKRLTTSAPVVFEDTKATTKLNYKIDTIKIPNHKIVSTVEIKLDDNTCVTHYNLEDKDQTVRVLCNKKVPKTFDIISSNLLIRVIVVAIAGFIAIKIRVLFKSNEPQRQIY